MVVCNNNNKRLKDIVLRMFWYFYGKQKNLIKKMIFFFAVYRPTSCNASHWCIGRCFPGPIKRLIQLISKPAFLSQCFLQSSVYLLTWFWDVPWHRFIAPAFNGCLVNLTKKKLFSIKSVLPIWQSKCSHFMHDIKQGDQANVKVPTTGNVVVNCSCNFY